MIPSGKRGEGGKRGKMTSTLLSRKREEGRRKGVALFFQYFLSKVEKEDTGGGKKGRKAPPKFSTEIKKKRIVIRPRSRGKAREGGTIGEEKREGKEKGGISIICLT